MNYEEEKAKILYKRNNLLKKYSLLFHETLALCHEIKQMEQQISGGKQKFDWLILTGQDEQMKKFNRLVAALLYVEEPENETIASNLKENIKLYKK